MSDDHIFGVGVAVMPQCRRPSFTPSTPAAIDVSRLVYSQLLAKNPNLNKMLLPEYLDYYTTACIWMRMITIKQRNSEPVDDAEIQILNMICNTSFWVPEPIMLQLTQLGNVVTATGEHLNATFPTLPQKQIGGRGGFYGVLQPPGPEIDDSLHNLYEEIPCLGVLSEAIMHAISDDESGPYQSVVTYGGLQPNGNLIGFRQLYPYRAPNAKNLAFDSHITGVNFEDYPANTAMNFKLLMKISNILRKTKGFRTFNVNFSSLSKVGSVSQTIVSRPLEGQINIRANIRTTSLARQSLGFYGEAVFFCPQLMKDSGPNGDHSKWCMISPTAGIPIPTQWVDNRNQRRNLPDNYMYTVFEGFCTIANASTYRCNLVREMVIA